FSAFEQPTNRGIISSNSSSPWPKPGTDDSVPNRGRAIKEICSRPGDGSVCPRILPRAVRRAIFRILAQRGAIGYNRCLLLSLFHDQQSGETQRYFDRFIQEDVLARLRRTDETARRKGLAALDPAADPLVPLGMEIDAAGHVTKNCYGVFNLSWEAGLHPEWADRVATEVQEIKQCER